MVIKPPRERQCLKPHDYKEVTPSREPSGTIPVVRGEENSEQTQPEIEEETWKGKMCLRKCTGRCLGLVSRMDVLKTENSHFIPQLEVANQLHLFYFVDVFSFIHSFSF